MLVVHTGNASCHVRSSCFVVPPSQWLWCHIPWSLDPWAPRPCPSSFMDGQISSLSLSVPQPHPSTKYFSGGFMDSLCRAVEWGLSTGSKDDTVTQGINPLFQGSPSVLLIGVTGCYLLSHWTVSKLEGSCSSFPVQCPVGNGAAGFGRKGWECALHPCQKGFPASTLWSTKLRSKVPSSIVTWDRLKEKRTFFFFRVSTHLFSSSSFVKKNKMFNS